MKTKLLTICLLLLCVGSTYAASGGLVKSTTIAAGTGKSLWGNIDEPVPPIQQIEQQQQQLQQEQQVLANEKTICELLTAQATLSADQTNATKIADAIKRVNSTVLPDYRMFLANPDTANDLYVKYRDLYLKTYCTATSK